MRIAHEDYFDPKKEQIDLSEKSLLEAMKNLDQFYAISKLKYACEFQNRNQILQNELPDIKFLKEIINESNEGNSILYQCFFLSYQLFQTRNESTYSTLKNLVFKNINSFSKENQHIFLTYLINHHNYRKKIGSPASKVDLLELFKFGVSNKFFIVDGVFDVNHFNNIVDLGWKQKEIDWTENFIKTCSPKLKEDVREQTVLISEISIQFAKGEFEKIIEQTKTTEFKGIHNKLRFRCMQIASYYEMDNYSNEDVIARCTACENFARKNKAVKEEMKKGLLNFTKIVKKLSGSRPRKEKIKTEFEKGGVFYFEDWLREKIGLL